MELHGAADVEGAVQHGVGAIEIADPDADLSKRRERDRQSRPLAEALVKVDGALGEREGLLVAVSNQRDVRLVAVHRRQHIVGLQQRGHALRLPKCRVGLVVAPGLREHDGRERVHHGQVTLVAGGVQGGGCLGNVLAHDRHVADLPIALAKVEVRQADGAGVVRDLRLFQRTVMQRDGPGLLAAGKRDPPMQSPEI